MHPRHEKYWDNVAPPEYLTSSEGVVHHCSLFGLLFPGAHELDENNVSLVMERDQDAIGVMWKCGME